jgi:hypothetical protein
MMGYGAGMMGGGMMPGMMGGGMMGMNPMMMGGGGMYANQTAALVGSIANASLFTPAEQGLLNQISDPAQKATFVLQKMMQRESLLASVLTNVSHMLYDTARGIAQNIR